jgi:hypothetical protein
VSLLAVSLSNGRTVTLQLCRLSLCFSWLFLGSHGLHFHVSFAPHLPAAERKRIMSETANGNNEIPAAAPFARQ